MKDRSLCPCCGQYLRNFTEDFGICEVCGWEEDCVQEDDPDYIGGANNMSLNQSKKIWEQTKSEEALNIANRRFLRKLPLFDETGRVILDEPE